MNAIETYSMIRENRGWTHYRDDKGGRVRLGRTEGKAVSLSIPAADYCERHGVELARVSVREVKLRRGGVPTLWKTFEFGHE